MQLKRPAEESAASGLMPLLDVVLLLLIFFIVTTTFRTPVVDLQLPDALTATNRDLKGAEVAVTADGALRIDDQAVGEEELYRRLLDRVPVEALVIRADREASHGAVMAVLDIARRAGIQNVEFAAQHPEHAAL